MLAFSEKLPRQVAESLAQWAKGRNVLLNLRHKISQIRHNDDNMILRCISHDPLLHPG